MLVVNVFAKRFLCPGIKGVRQNKSAVLTPSVIHRATRDCQATPLGFNAALVEIDYAEEETRSAAHLAFSWVWIGNEKKICNRLHICLMCNLLSNQIAAV